MAQGVVIAVLLLIRLLGEAEEHRFEARVAALRAAGAPGAPEDLKTAPVPDGRNAAKLLEEAAGLLDAHREREDADFWYLDIENATPAERDRVRRYLAGLGRYFDLLAKVPDRPEWHAEFRWDEDSGWPTDETFPRLQDARGHLIARVELDPEARGRVERAAGTAVLLVDLAERCRSRMIIGYLVQGTMASEPAIVLRAASRQYGFDAALFRRIVDPRLARADETPAFRRALAEERLHFIWLFRKLGQGKVPRGYADYLFLRGRLHVSFVWRPVLYHDANRLLDLFEEALAAGEAPPEEAETTATRLEASYRRGPHDLLLTGRTALFVARSIRAHRQFVAACRLTRVVMALLEYRQRERAWPESLAALGELPLDPFSGKPFVYERTAKGARVRAAVEAPWEEVEGGTLGWTLEDGQIATRPP